MNLKMSFDATVASLRNKLLQILDQKSILYPTEKETIVYRFKSHTQQRDILRNPRNLNTTRNLRNLAIRIRRLRRL